MATGLCFQTAERTGLGWVFLVPFPSIVAALSRPELTSSQRNFACRKPPWS